jgi:glycerophosphoryl diester phosphodiesterase
MTNPLFDPDARLVIGHRGDSAHAPENTLESLKQAVELGADAVEFDVRATRDGVVVLMHDATLERTTSGNGRLSDVDYGEVKALNAARGNPAWTGKSAAVPMLEHVLDALRATPLVIEVKELSAVESTVGLVHRFGLQGGVVLGSNDHDVVAKLERSGVRTCASRADAAVLAILALAGAMPSVKDYDVLSVTPRYYGIPIPVTRMAAAVRRLGIPTQVWTVNDPAQAVEYWQGGVCGIVSDDPAAMLRARPR